MTYFVKQYPDTAPQAGKFEFLKGLFSGNWIAWQIGSITGIFLGSTISSKWEVGYAGTLAILCILLPMTLNRAVQVGVITTGIVALIAQNLPYKLGMLVSVIVGMTCAMAWAEWQERRAWQR